MKNNLKKMLVLLLAANMFAGVTLPVFAEDSVTSGTTQETVTNPDGTTTEITTTTTVTPGETEGTTDITIEIDKKTEGTTEDGTQVEGEDHREETKTVENAEEEGEEETVISSSMTESGTETRTGTDGRVIESGYEGGSDMTTEENGVDNIIVDVPLTDKDDPETEDVVENVNTVEGRPAGTVLEQTGDLPESEDDGTYDYTTETVVKPSEVTVTTNEITVTENVGSGKTDLEYVYNETKPSNGDENGVGDNEVFIWVYKNDGKVYRTELPKKGEEIELEDGYAYKYLGTGLTSQYMPVYLYTSPSADYPNEEPYMLNGKKYYFRNQGKKSYDAIYISGEKITTEESFNATFSVPQQFVLVDGATGELITAYCADIDTSTVRGFNYNIENLEDADYYNEEQAAMIRTIAENGYWGTTGTEIDENGNEVPAQGSLEAMKKMLLASQQFTEEDLKYLTDGLALTATQMAIWNFSSQMGVEYKTAVHAKDHTAPDGEITSGYASGLLSSYTLTEEEEKATQLMYKLYNFLINMDPTEAKNTTADTIINEDNFIKSLEITVIEKAEDHENNQDADDTNDAYVTDVSFSLVVTPSTENGDDLVVKVLDADGNVIASARIAGENKEGESYDKLTPDDDGNYKLEGITITEGDHTFNITLEGIQNLEKGVYLYTSEVRTGDDGSEESSQTLVGLAEGSRAVNVSMSIDFSLNVDDEVVATEHVWRTEWTKDPSPDEPTSDEPTSDEPTSDDPTPKKTTSDEPEVSEEIEVVDIAEDTEEPENIEILDEAVTLADIPAEPETAEPETIEILDEDIPLTDIPDEPVPLTGDSMMSYISVLLAGIALTAIKLNGGKKKEKENA